MLKVEFTTYEILGSLKEKTFPFYHKTLIKDSIFNVPTGIFTPTESKNNIYTHGTFYPLITQPIFDKISILDVVWIKKDLFSIKQFLFTNEKAFGVHSQTRLTLLQIKQLLRKQKNQEYYTTMLVSQNDPYEKLDSLNVPIFLSEYFSFPLNFIPPRVNKMAIIYDPTLTAAQKEAMEIDRVLSKFAPKILEIHLYALPITEKQLENIFNAYPIVHYAGHMTSGGFLIQNKNSVIPKIISPPYFVFLNACQTPPSLVQYFASLNIQTLYSSKNQIDSFISQEIIKLFYTGFYLGYKMRDLLTILPEHLIFLGWAHFCIKGYFYVL